MAKKMNWKILGKKVGLELLTVLIIGGGSVWANQPLWLVLLPVLKGILNYKKHK